MFRLGSWTSSIKTWGSLAAVLPRPSLLGRTRPMATMSKAKGANGAAPHPELPTVHGNFDLVKRVKPDFADVLIEKWRSRVTGLTVVHVDYEAPIVKGHFVIATEIFNDSGCPHTLEHLIFLGSEKYPFKGVLDNLANRAFAEGTNAWTDSDHTVYTIDTAGGQGFLQLLPVYADHVLYPTLTSSGFVTEVHHINQKGEDAGVVYSEMQGRENTPGDLLMLRLQRAFYPVGNAYRSETGGLMTALRVLNMDQIRQYHRSYYVPHNICLIVTGKLSTASLLDVLQTSVEPLIISHGQAKGVKPPGWKRPFVETPTSHPVKFDKTVQEVVEFPEKDESMGEVTISFLGPSPNDVLEHSALDILHTYLVDSPVSPLTKEYVETSSPLCTSVFMENIARTPNNGLVVFFSSVPTEELEHVADRLQKSLKRIVAEGVDLARMRMLITRERRKLSESMETETAEVFVSPLIEDFLYGDPDGKDLVESMNEAQRYATLSAYTNEQWCSLIERYFIDVPSVVLLGKPSPSLAEQLEADEKTRIAAQVTRLGPEGLAQLGEELEQAKQEHDRPIPSEMLTSFPLPDVSTISWIPVQSAQNDPFRGGLVVSEPSLLEKHLQADSKELPFFVEYDHVQSDFVTVCAYLSTDKLPTELRSYVNMYLTSFFSLPVIRADGSQLHHEEVVSLLDEATVSYHISISSPFSQLLKVTIKVEPAQYQTAISWLRDLLYGSEFDVERLKITAVKLMQDLPSLKREGSIVLGSVHGSLLFDETSTALASALLHQLDFVPDLILKIEESPNEVVQHMQEFRRLVTDPSSLRFAVYGNVLALDKPRTAWLQNFRLLPKAPLSPVAWTSHSLSQLGQRPHSKGIVVSLPTIETSYAMHTVRTVDHFDHPDYPALRVATEVLNASESFLWRYIRGAGLAYGVNLSVDPSSSLLTLSIYKAPDSFKAFQEAATVIRGVLNGSESLEDTRLDAAKSTLVYNTTQKISTVGLSAIMSFTNQVLKGVPQNHHHTLLQRFQSVTKADVLSAIRTYVLPLFDPKKSVAVVVSSPNKAKEIAEGLESYGYEVEMRTLDLGPDEGLSQFSGDSMSMSGEESEDGR